MLMPNAEADLTVIAVDQIFHTLIPSRFPPIALFARIANDRDTEVGEIESLTNPRMKERERILSGVSVIDVDSPLVQNWNHAPFTYVNPEGTHFFGPDRPALELAEDLQTALAISVRKREIFLSRTHEAEIRLDMRVLTRRVHGRFADALGWAPEMPLTERRARGRRVIEAGLDGVLFRTPERPTAVSIAILTGSTLDRAVQGDHFQYVWNGSRISQVYAFRTGDTLEPELLKRAENMLAA